MLIWILFDANGNFVGAATSKVRLARLIAANTPYGGVPRRLEYDDTKRFLRPGWTLTQYHELP